MSDPAPVRRFFGAALMALGGLMMLLCGGCGALFLVGFLVSAVQSSNAEAMDMAIISLIIGGLPAVVGLGLFVVGRDLRRDRGPR